MDINIAFAADTNYFRFMETAALSAMLSKAENSRLCFHIFCDRVSDSLKDELRTVCQRHDARVRFYDSNIAEYENLPEAGKHISKATYLRFELAERITDVEKIIYLDCDVLVCADLARFYSRDISGYDFAAVEDLGYRQSHRESPNMFPIGGFYVNAGVLLVNLARWREGHYKEKFIKFCKDNAEQIVIGDQDALNLFCRGRILACSPVNNVQDSFYRFARRYNEWYDGGHEIEYAASHPTILHYTFKYKPWNTFSMPKADIWLKTYWQLISEARIENDEISRLMCLWRRNWPLVCVLRLERWLKDLILPKRFGIHIESHNRKAHALINQWKSQMYSVH